MGEGGCIASYPAGLRRSPAAGAGVLGGGEVGAKEGVRRELCICAGGEGEWAGGDGGEGINGHLE